MFPDIVSFDYVCVCAWFCMDNFRDDFFLCMWYGILFCTKQYSIYIFMVINSEFLLYFLGMQSTPQKNVILNKA